MSTEMQQVATGETLAPAPAQETTPPAPLAAEASGTLPEVALMPDWAPSLPELPADDGMPEHAPWTDQEIQAAIDTPAMRPTDYQVPSLLDGEDLADLSPQETQGLQQSVRGLQSLLWHAGFPVSEGNQLLHVAVEEARRVGEDMDDSAFELQMRSTQQTMVRMLGEAEYQRQRDALADLLTDLDRKTKGQLGEFLDDQAHVLWQPMVYHRLLAHASRAHMRKR